MYYQVWQCTRSSDSLQSLIPGWSRCSTWSRVPQALADVREVVTIAHSDLVTAMLAELGELALAVDAAEVAVVAEAVTRGVSGCGARAVPAALLGSRRIAALIRPARRQVVW